MRDFKASLIGLLFVLAWPILIALFMVMTVIELALAIGLLAIEAIRKAINR